MKDIDRLLQRNSIDDVNIPDRVENKIHYALNHLGNKSSKINCLKRIIAAFVSTIVALIGSVTVYAAFGGTIEGKPIFEWLGSNFDTEYENYKIEVQDQTAVYGETSIDLLSKMYNDGMVILEFDVKIGEEDMKKFDIWENQTINGIYMIFNGASNNWIATIDNKEYGIKTRSAQSYKKIADNEYIVYHMYFLTDKELKNKTDFNINILYAYINPIVRNDGENEDFQAVETVYFDCRGQMDIPFSKNELAENTFTYVPQCESMKYKQMTKTVETVTITPMQIIIKVSSKIENVSNASIGSTTHEDYIGLMRYDAYDQNGNKIGMKNYQTLNKITYANGKSEEWDIGDIGTYKSFKNATMELMEYFIIEKKDDCSSIKIVAQEEIIENPTGENWKQRFKDIGDLNIELKANEVE